MNAERGTRAESGLALMRQGCYRVLAAGFGRPTLERTDQIDAGLLALEALGIGAFPFAQALRSWEHALVAADPCEIETEYVRLFGSGMDAALCPPIESQHLGQNLQGDPARYAGRIEDLMRRSGLKARSSDRPPDHVVVELEVASALCGAEAAAREAGEPATKWLELEAEVVAILEGWVPRLTALVAERDDIGVFAQLCSATTAVVRHDHDFVRLLLSEGAVS